MPEEYQNHLYTLILAGGGGTRLWPKSKNKTPKQFLKLFGGKTLTQITCERFALKLPWERMFCVTVSEEYKQEILKEVPQFLSGNIIVEPFRRDTAPAHAIGATIILQKDPEAVIITEAVDRLVSPIEKYLETVETAAKVAFEKKVLVSIGVKPLYPHTGLGHIKIGQPLYREGTIAFYKVDRFVEKPSLELAKEYTASGLYLWNAGQYVWRADVLLAAIEKYAPEIAANLHKIPEGLAKVYETMPTISIDYAVSEKADNMVVIAADFLWTDIGDWNEVWKNLPKDGNNNVIIDGEVPGGEVINIDTNDTLIQTDGRLIAVIDVDNIIIVDTKDALLVCAKDRAQSVKQIVETLKEKNRKELL
jgi:mannose-1-phosphate guanylyltransferase